jgi:broad specificity phosphatase PhoE
MTTQITMSDLIAALRSAASNPEAHEQAQQSHFSTLQEDSVLVSHGIACDVAGYLMLKAHEGASEEEVREITNLDYYSYDLTPGEWVARELGLSDVEATLAFSSCTHHQIHLLLADILEAGRRLPDVERLGVSSDSLYTSFDWAYLANQDYYISLEQLKQWMQSFSR